MMSTGLDCRAVNVTRCRSVSYERVPHGYGSFRYWCCAVQRTRREETRPNHQTNCQASCLALLSLTTIFASRQFLSSLIFFQPLSGIHALIIAIPRPCTASRYKQAFTCPPKKLYLTFVCFNARSRRGNPGRIFQNPMYSYPRLWQGYKA